MNNDTMMYAGLGIAAVIVGVSLYSGVKKTGDEIGELVGNVGGDVHQITGNVAGVTNLLKPFDPMWWKGLGDPDAWLS